jgi:hypothetical protein
MRRTVRGICLLAALVVAGRVHPTLASTAEARANDERVTVRAELGAEYDDNVHRAEQIPGMADAAPRVASAVARGVFGLSAASDSLPHEQEVAFSILGAGKLFLAPAARSENVVIVDNSGSWRIATDRHGKLGITASYYEATQSGTETERALSAEARDFRSLVPMVRLVRFIGASSSLGLAAGYRWFVYKPQRSYDFLAPVLSLEYRLVHETTDGDADWEVTAAAGVELRRFAGSRLVSDSAGCSAGACPPALDPTGTRHVDQFFTGQIDVTRTGGVLVGAGYLLQWNRSNSRSESLLRHVGTVRLTAPLPLDLYLAARAELVLVTYSDKVTLAVGPTGQTSASIEDEKRSQLRAELSRSVTAGLQLVARYSLYVNALGEGVGTYRRQTATLSLVYTAD